MGLLLLLRCAALLLLLLLYRGLCTEYVLDEGLGDLSGGTRGEEPSVEAGSPETPCLALSRLLSTPASRLGEGGWVPAGLFQRSVEWGAAFSVDSAGSAVGDWRLASSSGRQRDVVPEKPCPYHEKPSTSLKRLDVWRRDMESGETGRARGQSLRSPWL
ncbi:uncharacterized protein NECHADRAFT_75687 [Fusarium vanettenii 77-13-4]|uniref:Uncharacterized protein n=1 Tax=Fusarium vanettenii (strain ATCC MYA-4622 / CBS 123669 / FGSC 9596 / NRRL 45880 / 77-13-4) TaxID=660122 RepID=C7YJI2_FUSV7|nr:uncharacterized protein NECHADRAFT_75687 [Fusarium vanettenii 77-13-4]EEU48978.1 predicted protein [Fusarium vanettenii 77-13-4]